MTAALYDEVVTAASAPKLRVVRDTDVIQAPAPQPLTGPVFGPDGDPLINGAARLLSIPLRHVYAVLWRAGVLEVGY